MKRDSRTREYGAENPQKADCCIYIDSSAPTKRVRNQSVSLLYACKAIQFKLNFIPAKHVRFIYSATKFVNMCKGLLTAIKSHLNYANAHHLRIIFM